MNFFFNMKIELIGPIAYEALDIGGLKMTKNSDITQGLMMLWNRLSEMYLKSQISYL